MKIFILPSSIFSTVILFQRYDFQGTTNGKHSQSVVTASVDGVKASANINVMNDLKLQSYLTYVGKSSMEV